MGLSQRDQSSFLRNANNDADGSVIIDVSRGDATDRSDRGRRSANKRKKRGEYENAKRVFRSQDRAGTYTTASKQVHQQQVEELTRRLSETNEKLIECEGRMSDMGKERSVLQLEYFQLKESHVKMLEEHDANARKMAEAQKQASELGYERD